MASSARSTAPNSSTSIATACCTTTSSASRSGPRCALHHKRARRDPRRRASRWWRSPPNKLVPAAEEVEADPGAKAPGGVGDRPDHHGSRGETRGHRLALERRHHEPGHERRRDCTKKSRRHYEPRAIQAAERRGENYAPDAAPERERP